MSIRPLHLVLAVSMLALVACGDRETGTESGASSALPQMRHLVSYDSGLGEGACEIVSYEPTTKRAYVVNAVETSVDILDLSNPAAPRKVGAIKVEGGQYGDGNSVAVKQVGDRVLVAIAVENADKQAPGWVVVTDGDGTRITEVEVGALPDMVTFTPDGQWILAAIEGEPSKDYQVDPAGGMAVISTVDWSVRIAGFDAFSAADLATAGVRVFGPGASPSQDLEGEYIAVSKDSTTAWLCLQENNALAVVDIPSATVTRIAGLGAKDLTIGAYDLSDKDGKVERVVWSARYPALKGRILSLYQPDSIYAFSVDGRDYIITANEGDAREYFVDVDGDDEVSDADTIGYIEETRLGKLTLDPEQFPDAEAIQDKAALGRLKVTTANGDLDGDGDYDLVYGYGGRSFAIWDADAKLVYDSGDGISAMLEAEAPQFFNAKGAKTAKVDNRSDDKGAEPEGVVVGMVGDRTLAFVGLERSGGVVMIDVSDPRAPQMLQYINTADGDGGGDVAPEGLAFVSAADSPTGTALLLAACEVSGTLAIYAVE